MRAVTVRTGRCGHRADHVGPILALASACVPTKDRPNPVPEHGHRRASDGQARDYRLEQHGDRATVDVRACRSRHQGGQHGQVRNEDDTTSQWAPLWFPATLRDQRNGCGRRRRGSGVPATVDPGPVLGPQRYGVSSTSTVKSVGYPRVSTRTAYVPSSGSSNRPTQASPTRSSSRGSRKTPDGRSRLMSGRVSAPV